MSTELPAMAAQTFFPTVDRWAVAWVKPRCEKALTEYFQARAVPCFLPLVAKRKIYGSHVRTSQLPLFSGYVFFGQDAIPAPQVFESRKVAQILAPDDPKALRAELANLALALACDRGLRAARFGRPGQPVWIARGPLKGLAGELVRIQSKSLLVVRVRFLGKAASLEIDEAFIEPVL